jgi:hypothetical protein
MSNEKNRADKMAATGSGVGGSGGAKLGRVKQELMMGVGHLIPMENVKETSRLTAEWIGGELVRWKQNEALLADQWKQVPAEEKYMMSKRFMAVMASDLGAGASKKPGGPKL